MSRGLYICAGNGIFRATSLTYKKVGTNRYVGLLMHITGKAALCAQASVAERRIALPPVNREQRHAAKYQYLSVFAGP